MKIPFILIWIHTATIILTLILLLRINLRWQSLLRIRKLSGFNISFNGWLKSVIFECFYWGFFLFISWMLFSFYKTGMPIVIILGLYIIESFLHLLMGRRNYKIVVKENMIITITNTITIISWSEISKIVKRHNDFQFKLSNETIRLLDLDLIRKEERDELSLKIKKLAIQKGIYVEN